MCLLTFAWKIHPEYKLIFISNRDEFYHRPTAPLHPWESSPKIWAGKDLEAGGTWMGANEKGDWTALTNYRDLKNIMEEAPSRGMLTLNYLQKEIAPETYLQNIAGKARRYNGFNLLVGNTEEVFYLSNYENKIRKLDKGIYGLSNHLLNTDWFKVRTLRADFEQIIQQNSFSEIDFFQILQNTTTPPDEDVQQTGLSKDMERMLAPPFIVSEKYGTNSSTVFLMDYENRVQFFEKYYNTPSKAPTIQSFEWLVDS